MCTKFNLDIPKINFKIKLFLQFLRKIRNFSHEQFKIINLYFPPFIPPMSIQYSRLHIYHNHMQICLFYVKFFWGLPRVLLTWPVMIAQWLVFAGLPRMLTIWPVLRKLGSDRTKITFF